MRKDLDLRIEELAAQVLAEQERCAGRRVSYSNACKQEAMSLMREGVKASALSRRISVHPTILRRWRWGTVLPTEAEQTAQESFIPKRLSLVESPSALHSFESPSGPVFEVHLRNGIILRNVPFTAEALDILIRRGA